MRSMTCTWWSRVNPAIVAAVMVTSCAPVQDPEPLPVQKSCEFVVTNGTPLALEIRIQVHASSTMPIGALNPGELLTHSVPCVQKQIWIAGFEIPWQVGAPLRFGILQSMADLVEGERVQITLVWP